MKLINKELLRALVLGFIIFIVLYLIALAQGKYFGWDLELAVQFLYIMLYTVMLHLGNAGVFVVIDRVFGNTGLSVKRLLVGVMSSFIVSLLIVLALRIFEDVIIEGECLVDFFATERVSDYYMAMIITMVITLSLHLFHFYKKYQENRVKQQKIIAGTASAKFETLKNQIDPHFLFNSLNVLSSLIEENPDSAQRFTTSLSKVYRYVLEQKDKELVSVEEELAFAKTYMNLLKMRFENSVFYEVPQQVSSSDARVVPLSLQLLLENTVKHNIVSQEQPLHIRIFEEDGFLVVQNDYQKKEVLQDRKGVGLQNIISRYAIISSRQVVIEQTEKYFTVKLPVLTKQVNIMQPVYSEKNSSYERAQKKVEDIKGFYGNLFSYIVIISGLAILNLVTSPKHLWFFWPAFGWGIGVIIHAMSVFNILPFMGSGWEERKIREIMDRKQNEKWR
ncbi:histidine kinase [Flavobacterium sp. Sd200]|uniref:2TM domain-containing protein n=1 Tax=Flavobacterium sp. Sd200 TaxID=2692211 RepID=UPI001368D5D0|nr:2TM domain-containing protein [Flavobacterium sp. Sd200]MXN89878.1 histidine kinase [Flavobacterium sp. Sd200]